MTLKNNAMERNIVKLKISNGHQIWILKTLVNKYKYLGIYSKKIEKEEDNGNN